MTMRKITIILTVLACSLFVLLTLIGCSTKATTNNGSIIDWQSIPVDPSFILDIYNYSEGSLENNSSTDDRAAYVGCDDLPDPVPSTPDYFDGSVWVITNDVQTRANEYYISETFGILEQPISLRNGANTIVAVVLNADGSGYKRTEAWTINGTFSNPLYRAQLTWDTPDNDVDLHLVRNDTWDDSNHCYYYNETIAGMAGLDYDDTDGWGPENMSLETTAPSGSYKVIVKYFDGEVTVNATVDIFDQNDALVSTSTHQFTKSDISVYDDEAEATDWNVTTLTVP
jgi:hypothetical protein